MVVHGQIEELAGRDQLAGNGPVLGRRCGISAWVIVHDDDSRGRLCDRGAEYFAWVHQRAVEQPSCDQDITEHLALTVQREKMELLNRQITQPGLEETNDIIRLAYSRQRCSALAAHPRRQLESGEQSCGLGGPDTRQTEQLRRRTCR